MTNRIISQSIFTSDWITRRPTALAGSLTPNWNKRRGKEGLIRKIYCFCCSLMLLFTIHQVGNVYNRIFSMVAAIFFYALPAMRLNNSHFSSYRGEVTSFAIRVPGNTERPQWLSIYLCVKVSIKSWIIIVILVNDKRRSKSFSMYKICRLYSSWRCVYGVFIKLST
jgi:hypothetical protein